MQTGARGGKAQVAARRRRRAMQASIAAALLLLAPALARGQAPAATPPIGIARMEADGTLLLDLRAEGSGGLRGHGRFVYRRGDKDYEMVLKHLGGMQPGETKPVPPWKEEKGTK